MKKIVAIIFSIIFISQFITGCDGHNANVQDDSEQAEKGKLSVVTTIFPEYDWVKQIMGEKSEDAQITMLLDNGIDLHSYQPTADDIIKLSTCDLFVYVGGESNGWVEDALKIATNKNMKVINLLDVLGNNIKTEDAKLGMQSEDGHNHGVSYFADSDVQDRSITDWDGEWQSVYTYLEDGTLDEVMERKAENGGKTAEEYRAYYEAGYKTDITKITIDGKESTIAFKKNGVEVKAVYEYKGYQIYDYASGTRGARYFFEAVDEDTAAPKFVQFSDHGIAPGKAEHFHIYFGNEGFDKLSQQMENWPTYYPMSMNGSEIAEDMLEHEEKEYDEHVWLSLRNAEILCKAISDELQEIDPDNKEIYAANTASYIQKLAQLDRNYSNVVNEAKYKTVLFGDRFPFRYMVDDYGIDYYAAFAGCSAESEASFETVYFLAKKLDELKLPCVLTIEGTQHKIAETIVENTTDKKQKILTLDSMQSTTSKDVDNGAAYLRIMEKNLEVLKEALN